MCGISGIINSNNKRIEASEIKRMCNQMIHRGPDDEGIYLDNSNGYSVALGHRRLSIIDLTSGHQPIFNEDKSLAIVFNGEIYNFKELRQELELKGHKFSTNSDTEVVIHLYEEYKEKSLDFLRGPFAFAIWDKRKSRLFMARDRLGKRPLLYAFQNENFAFASEFRAILTAPGISKEIDLEAQDAYLTYGYVPAPLSIYKGIYKLLPGYYLILENKRIEIKKYWSLDFKEKIHMAENEITQAVREKVTEAVKIRMISDVPLGAFLSGGIDSSIVVGLMSQLSNQRIRTFSIGFSEKEYNELNYARIVAKRFDTNHQEFIVKPKIEEILPILIERYGEPYADSSAVPSYYLTKITRPYVTVALNGDGGDELFAGYQRHWANRLASSGAIRLFLKLGGEAALNRLIPAGLYYKNFFARLKRFAQAATDSQPARYQKWVGIFGQELKDSLYTAEFKKISTEFRSIKWLEDVFEEADGLDPVDSFLYADTFLNLPNDFLVKMDIACMTNSLEGRSPFLDHKLMEFAASIPSEFKLKGSNSKYILKKAFEDLLPKEIFRRGKMGFALPIGFWFKNELKDFVKDILLSDIAKKRVYFNPIAIAEMLEDHFRSRNDYTHQIWALLMLEMWHQKFIDQAN